MDSCPRLRTNYFAVDVQFVNSSNKIVIYTLAVKHTKADHSSDAILSPLLDVLREYELPKRKVLSIVTDNASNMISVVEKPSAESNEHDAENDDNQAVVFTDMVGDDTEFDSDDHYEKDESTVIELDMLNAMAAAELTSTEHMRCAVHTFQLAIRDGLKARNIANLLAHVRKVVVAARARKVDEILKRRCNKSALLDQATR